MFREFYVAASHEEALRRARRSIEAKYRAYVDHGFPGASAQVARGLDELLEDTFIVGSPRECVERLEACAELGVTHLGLRLFWPAMEQAEVLQMIELTAAQVLPALRRLGS